MEKFRPKRPSGNSAAAFLFGGLWDAIWGGKFPFKNTEQCEWVRGEDGYYPIIKFPPKGSDFYPFEIYFSGRTSGNGRIRVSIHTGLLFPGHPDFDFESGETPYGTDFSNKYFEFDPAVDSYAIYLARVPEEVAALPYVPGFIAVPDADPSAAIWIENNTEFDWSQYVVGNMHQYAIWLGDVNLTDGKYSIEQHSPVPALWLINHYPQKFIGVYNSGSYYINGNVVLYTTGGFNYQFVLDVAGDVDGDYYMSNGPVSGVAPDPAETYPWRMLSKWAV